MSQRLSGRIRSNLLVAGLVPLLAACTSYPCTAMGCGSHVSVDLSKIGVRYGSIPATATMCVNEDCLLKTVKLTGPNTTTLLDLDLPRAAPPSADATPRVVHVALTLERAGEVLVDTHADATLTKFTPNGQGCAPTCYTALLRLEGSHLVPVPSSTR